MDDTIESQGTKEELSPWYQRWVMKALYIGTAALVLAAVNSAFDKNIKAVSAAEVKEIVLSETAPIIERIDGMSKLNISEHETMQLGLIDKASDERVDKIELMLKGKASNDKVDMILRLVLMQQESIETIEKNTTQILINSKKTGN